MPRSSAACSTVMVRGSARRPTSVLPSVTPTGSPRIFDRQRSLPTARNLDRREVATASSLSAGADATNSDPTTLLLGAFLPDGELDHVFGG